MTRALIMSLLVASGCGGAGGAGGTATGTETDPGTSTDATATSAGSGTDSTTSGTGSGPGSTSVATTGAQCLGGAYASCLEADGTVSNAMCGHNPGTFCLVDDVDAPASSICSVRGCESVADCVCPPDTGAAVPSCEVTLAEGEKACVLRCDGGETCPDGAACVTGRCMFPKPDDGGTGTSTSTTG